ncbi:hypothetical protein [Paenibacillus sp. TC-CSREp1]|uniref:hypothetical protein n=1 Tax=Paenibacillus sp. TC-CSREp1 TaxID=3410089 RepID=UPI003CFA217F
MISVHDNEVISYEVNLKDKYIVVHTENRGEAVKIDFKHVMAHLFEEHLCGSILLDITEYEMNRFIDEHKEVFEKHKPYGWPINYESIDELTEVLTQEQYKCYIISSSYGFNGWVLAKELNMTKKLL